MAQPLAERMRPKTLDEYIGQKHLVGEGAVLRRMIEAGGFLRLFCGDRRESERPPWRRL